MLCHAHAMRYDTMQYSAVLYVAILLYSTLPPIETCLRASYQDWSLTFGWKALIETRNKSCPPVRNVEVYARPGIKPRYAKPYQRRCWGPNQITLASPHPSLCSNIKAELDANGEPCEDVLCTKDPSCCGRMRAMTAFPSNSGNATCSETSILPPAPILIPAPRAQH